MQHITHLDIVANQASPQRSSVGTLSITLVVPFIVPYNTWLPEYILQFIYIFYFHLQSPHSSVQRVNRLIPHLVKLQVKCLVLHLATAFLFVPQLVESWQLYTELTKAAEQNKDQYKTSWSSSTGWGTYWGGRYVLCFFLSFF